MMAVMIAQSQMERLVLALKEPVSSKMNHTARRQRSQRYLAHPNIVLAGSMDAMFAVLMMMVRLDSAQ